jgi:hypothetical protein
MGSPYRCRPGGDSGRGGTKHYIPDNGICERFHRTLLDEFYRVVSTGTEVSAEVGT